ncbi:MULTISPECIES: hypothetical protein [unclassified Streptomyces]|uniref:hypothetical protein n=1 Tax=unclassified Streptomyces TaxID=2593676 RepID=UPI001906B0E2|nr:hypothetical protein [Streptomyces sp. HSG2]
MTAPTRPRSAPVSPDVALPPPLPPLRRVWSHPRLTHHNRLAVLVVAVNLVVFAVGFGGGRAGWDSAALGRLALVNVALAVIVRQQYVINLLFRCATAVPLTWPLCVRRTLAKVYHFGGLHVGGALMGVVWFLAQVAMVTAAGATPALLAVSYTLAALLGALVVLALPSMRARHHDLFERSHRFGGWAALSLLWAHTLLSTPSGSDGLDASVWVLAVLTLSVALPWTRLRRVAVHVDRPSSHVAIAGFDHGETPFPGSSTTISRSPLTEWHSFANVPTPGREGFRLVVSRAGDWTGSFIDDPPSHVWVKGITTAGVARVERLFHRVVYVATGSGIGPVLPHLLAAEVPSRLVWATRSPRRTYGDALVEEILDAQPDAVVWDTAEHGKPDMVRLAYAACREFDAEAVICISNKRLTWAVVHGMERLGIPAYGAIWDS